MPRSYHGGHAKADNVTQSVKSLALSIVQAQQRNIRIHDWTVLATVLLHRLRQGQSTTLLDTLLSECHSLDSLIRRTAVDHDSRPEFSMSSIRHCTAVHKSIIRWNTDRSGVEVQPLWLNDLKVIHVLLAHYRNQLLHCVVSPALGAVLSRAIPPLERDLPSFLVKMFAWEFALSSETSLTTAVDSSDMAALSELIEPFFVGYAIILRLLLKESFVKSANLKSARILGKDLQRALATSLESGAYPALEILSLDLISNCLQALKGMKAIRIEVDQSVTLCGDLLGDVSRQLESLLQPTVLVALDVLSAGDGDTRTQLRALI